MVEFKYSKDDLAQLVFKDELTDLHNRRFMYRYLDQNIPGSGRTQSPFSLLMIDVDSFKDINDSFGHLEGDHMLKELSLVLAKNLRPTDIPVRYAGDEFSILLPETDKTNASRVAESIRQAVASTKFFRREKGQPISITISIGVATFPDDARNRETLIDEADKALYNSKNKGKNCVSEAGKLDEGVIAEYNLLSTLPCPAFIGREEVLNDLMKSLEAVKNGENAFVFLEGEVGVGKTSILKELEHRNENDFLAFFTVLVETDRLQPYKPIIALLKKTISSEKNIFDTAALKIKPEYRPELKTIFPELSSDIAGESGKENRKLLFEGMVSLLTAVSEIKPIIILLDEIQNIDEGSMEIITCLSESDSGRVLTAAALRSSYLDILSTHHPRLEKFLSEIAGTPNFSHQPLVPFNQTLTNNLLDYILPNRGPLPAFERKIYELTRGNPLFIEEIVKNFILRKKISIKDKKLFHQVCIELGALTWSNGADIDPVWLHEEIGKNKMWCVPG
ncbi:MAG: diguanylate cyclase [Planctomycetota bacterium]